MSQRIVQVDAFSDRPFAWQPAAVCVLNEPRDDAWMQNVALEMNLSETAFLVPEAEGFNLRVVHADGRGRPLRSRNIGLSPRPLGRRLSLARRHRAIPDQERLALGIEGRWLDHARLPRQAVESVIDPEILGNSAGYPGRLFRNEPVRCASRGQVGRKAVRGLFSIANAENAGGNLRPGGSFVTARAESPGFDFVSRFFAPQSGVRKTR